MKKIEITQEIINKHRDYYSNNILPLFGEYEKKVQFNDSSYKNKHVAFLKFCKDNYEKFAIGEPKELMKLLNEIETNHSTVLKMIKDRIKCEFTSVEKPYNEVLLEMFGYNKFIDSNSVEILKRAVRSVKRINKTSEVRARVLEKIRGVVQIDNFDERISRINNDTELKEFFKKNIKRDFTLRDYKDFSVLSECWNAYAFIFSLEIRTCPYCNRQYITPIYSENGKVRADLDHFLPKKKYPFFSMSLYNLVPSCKFCNSSIKGTKEYEFKMLHPYKDDIDKHIKFRMDILNGISVELVDEDDENARNYRELFKLESLYSYHSNKAKELLVRKLVYTDKFIEGINSLMGTSYSTKEIKQLLIGYKEEEKINQEPLSKFKLDLIEQLNFEQKSDSLEMKDLLNKLEKLK